MREILFRGKNNDGDWVYGYINQHRGDSILDCKCEQINGDDFYIYDYAAKIDTGIYGLLYKIIPETVGQYTGLTDKNGVKIFEGDIVKHYSSVYEISYITKYTRFAGKDGSCIFAGIPLENTEVIGNIHDNPELMEGGGENG